jgi:hypothetical protein
MMNEVELDNKRMYDRYGNYLCIHCKHLTYYDWYYCRKRTWGVMSRSLKSLWYKIKNYDTICCDGLKWYFKNIFDSECFLPDIPIKKCKFYEHHYIKRFWTSITRSDGSYIEDTTTVWKDKE